MTLLKGVSLIFQPFLCSCNLSSGYIAKAIAFEQTFGILSPSSTTKQFSQDIFQSSSHCYPRWCRSIGKLEHSLHPIYNQHHNDSNSHIDKLSRSGSGHVWQGAATSSGCLRKLVWLLHNCGAWIIKPESKHDTLKENNQELLLIKTIILSCQVKQLGGSSKGSKEFGKDELNPLPSLETEVQRLREVIWCKKDVHQNIILFVVLDRHQ